MRLLLPPSETKEQGGTGPVFDAHTLFAPELLPVRVDLISALEQLCADEDEAMRVLKLGERLRGEVAVNRQLLSSPTLPALRRYTGVLYDALGAGELTGQDWERAGGRVLIQSSLFGPIRATDLIPAYRLSATTPKPIGPLKRRWSAATDRLWDGESFLIDARSESYRALSPIPADVSSVFVRVVTRSASGAMTALNHFNKATKGRLAAELIRSDDVPASRADLVEWGFAHGFRFSDEDCAPGEISLMDAAPVAG
ncbi:MAG: YaaA family protein [Mycetocola sp.]